MSSGDRAHYRPEIDGLRAIAVVAVILFHAGIPLFSGGYVGVDVFFVISGYLIVGIVWRDSERGRFAFGEFYRRRVLRLLPATIFVCTLVALVGLLVLLPSDLRRLGRSLAATMAYGSNVWFWRSTGYFEPGAESLPLLHTWSLSVEEQFYALAPLCIVIVHRHARRHALALLAVAAAATLIATQLLLPTRQSVVFYLTPFRAWELLVGGILAIGGWRIAAPRARWTVETLGLAAVLLPVALYTVATPFPGAWAIVPCLGTGALLLSSSDTSDSIISRLLRSTPFVELGKLSYALYLWHWPVFVFWGLVTGHAHSAAHRAGMLAVTVLGAWLTHRFVEAPFRDPARPQARATFTFSLAASAALFVVGVALGRSAGLPGRYGQDVLALDRAREPVIPFDACFGHSVVDVDDRCVLGARAHAPTWLLWGDSHALAIAPAIDAALAERGESAAFVASSACPPVYEVRARDIGWGSLRCEETSARARRVLEGSPAIRNVIMVAVWPSYLADETYLLSDARGEAGNARILHAGLVRTLGALAARGVEVAIVGSVPRQPFNVPTEMARTARWHLPPPRGVSLAAEQRAQMPFLDLIAGVRQELDGSSFTLIDMTAHFCTGDRCAIGSAETPLYRDAHHLSLAGSRFAMSALEPTMDAMRARSASNADGR